jgi:NADH-quinone oxidoreductase subunit D
MSTEAVLDRAEALLLPWSEAVNRPEPNRVDVRVRTNHLLDAVAALTHAHWGYLSAITGLESTDGPLEALYHFCTGPHIATLRVEVLRSLPSVPSVCAIIPSASVFERELSDLFGFTIVGASDTSRLLLPDDWPADVHPLRKNADLSDVARVAGQTSSATSAVGNGRFVIPIGPQHPALKEPGHFEFTVDGEVVTAASVRLGYAHRGIEKATESRSWIQNLYLLERVCGICSHVHALAYCEGVEHLAHVSVPPRARAIRELVAEMERIHSHLLWLGVTAHEAGFETLFMYTWRDRETVMDLLEELTGNRVNYSANRLGGVKIDVDSTRAAAIRAGVEFLRERTSRYLEDVSQDETFLRRTRRIGMMSADQAETLGVVGPTARASGVRRDIRVDSPYAAYASFGVEPILRQAGDLEARVVVRLLELFESYRVIDELLDNLPEGPIATRMPRRVPAGETISRVEAPRGELLYFVKSNGSDRPERIKIRTPTLCNLGSAIHLTVGRYLADVPMLLAGVDPCFSCNDRGVVISHEEKTRRWTWADLRQHGIDFYRSEPA